MQTVLVAETVPGRLEAIDIGEIFVIQIFLQLPGVRHLDRLLS